MKNVFISATIAAMLFTACSSENNTKDESVASNTVVTQTEQQADSTKTTPTTPVDEIITNYLHLKNALAADKSQEAANAGDELVNVLKNFDTSSLTPEQTQMYQDVEEDMTEHAEHIGDNVDNMEHQREHFEILSEGLYDLVKTFDNGQKLYLDYCPMYNNNKGAVWLSETKEINNPYMGKAMPSCGEVKEEIN